MNKLSGLLLAVLLLLFAAWGNAWAKCLIENPSSRSGCSSSLSGGCSPSNSWVEREFSSCVSTPYYCAAAEVWCGMYGSISGTYCKQGSLYRCENQCEVDSLVCVQDGGGTWTNTGASTCDGKSCKMSNCLQSDTLWLNDSKAACDAIGGENNYAIADIDETCVHSGICCPPDSALVGNTCKWRCDSLYAACNAKNGYLYAGVLQDTTISGSDSTFTNKCYYNCSYAYNKDSTTSVTDGNTACSSPSTPIADCTRMPNDFSSVRTTYGDSVYSYDFLTPGSAAYIDSIVLTPCSRFMYRCTVNGKYKYWYSDADIPTGCTNIVKIK